MSYKICSLDLTSITCPKGTVYAVKHSGEYYCLIAPNNVTTGAGVMTERRGSSSYGYYYATLCVKQTVNVSMADQHFYDKYLPSSSVVVNSSEDATAASARSALVGTYSGDYVTCFNGDVNACSNKYETLTLVYSTSTTTTVSYTTSGTKYYVSGYYTITPVESQETTGVIDHYDWKAISDSYFGCYVWFKNLSTGVWEYVGNVSANSNYTFSEYVTQRNGSVGFVSQGTSHFHYVAA